MASSGSFAWLAKMAGCIPQTGILIWFGDPDPSFQFILYLLIFVLCRQLGYHCLQISPAKESEARVENHRCLLGATESFVDSRRPAW